MPHAAAPRRSPRSTLVLLVRHGRTRTTGTTLPGRAPGLHLSEDGHREAEGLVARLAPIPRLAAVYASPLERTRETAAPLARARRLAIRIDPGLVECDFGRWTGARLRVLRRKPEWRAVQRYPSSFRFPGGESFVEMQARITAALGRLVARHPGEAVVAVSHADPIKVAVAHALGTHLDLFQRIVIAPASVTAIAFGVDAPAVLAVNSTGSLEGLVGR
jgi:probable phosphoglycerate mutase